MILIVDDDEDVRATIRHSLEMLSYESREAEDGASAIAIVRETRPEAVILDYMMPGMNGAEVAAEIARIDPSIPIIFASGYAQEGELRKLLGHHRPVLHKPFLVGELAELIDRALGGREGGTDQIR